MSNQSHLENILNCQSFPSPISNTLINQYFRWVSVKEQLVQVRFCRVLFQFFFLLCIYYEMCVYHLKPKDIRINSEYRKVISPSDSVLKIPHLIFLSDQNYDLLQIPVWMTVFYCLKLPTLWEERYFWKRCKSMYLLNGHVKIVN